MPRPVKHDENRILGAAAALVAERGPAATTVTAIGQAIGAPNGSIYHRFRTRDELLGRLWLNKAAYFQDRCMAALAGEADARRAGLAAALSLPQAVRDDFQGARIMLLYRREDFFAEGWPQAMQDEAERLGEQLRAGVRQAARRLFGSDSKRARQITRFATIDLPFSAVYPYVRNNEVPPALADELIARAYSAVVSAEN